jgi:hypothetical protein
MLDFNKFREKTRMARRNLEVVEEEEIKEETELTMDDFFSQEIDMGEYEEVSKSLVVPEGKYYTVVPYTSKIEPVKVKVGLVDEEGQPTGETKEIHRPVARFFGAVLSEDGARYMLGLNVSPLSLYARGNGEDRELFLKQVAGTKPDSATKHWHQAIKLLKKQNGVPPSTNGEVIEFLQQTQLRLTNRVFQPDEEGAEPIAFVVNFNLADA